MNTPNFMYLRGKIWKNYFIMRKLNVYRGWLLVIGLTLCIGFAHAQRIAVKTNALYWAALTPNVGLECRMSRHFTLNIEGEGSPVSFGQIGLKHGSVLPEARYWFSGRPQTRHFVGLAGMVTIYNFRFGDTIHGGSAVGGGVTYGYSYVINKRWSIEGTLGLGVLQHSGKKYDTNVSMPDNLNAKGVVFAPIKLGISAVYILK